MGTTASHGVECARGGIHEDPRTTHDLRVLRRRERHLNYIDAKQRRIGILFRLLARTSRQLFVLTDKRSSRDINVDVVLVLRIHNEGVCFRTAAGVYRCHLLRILDVADVKDSYAAETIL